MVAKCANAGCANEFRYLAEGRLFVRELETRSNPKRKLDCHWLCAKCCETFTVIFTAQGASICPRSLIAHQLSFEQAA